MGGILKMVVAVKRPEIRTYSRHESITFRKTKERFGGLSNMAAGFLLNVNGVKILTSEALYQACRFPNLPEVQRQIIAERSPMTAKMISKPYRKNSRPDWDRVRTKIMRWCLQVKLVQNWDTFSKLLLDTGNLPIVEDSRKDDFWGAKPQDEEILVGANVLGRLLMQLREQLKNEEITSKTIVNPLTIPDFLLYQKEIKPISKDGEYCFNNPNNSWESEKTLIQFNSDLIDSDSDIVQPNISNNDLDLNEQSDSNVNPKKDWVAVTELKFDKYDSLQYILPHIVESLQDAERTDQELAELFKVNKTQMRDWLKRAVQIGKVKKLLKPVRYVAESQLPLIS